MNVSFLFKKALVIACAFSLGATVNASTDVTQDQDQNLKVPGFSIDYMDRSIDPAQDFYHFANGNWVKNNPVPEDKAIWTSFGELSKRNDVLLEKILETARDDKDAPQHSPTRLVGDFYISAMDTERLEKLRFTPIQPMLFAIDQANNVEALFKLFADFHQKDLNALFYTFVQPDDKNSDIYAFQFYQGGLSLPDRDYYLKDDFEVQREAYLAHIKNMFMLLGESPDEAANHAATVMSIETEIAKAHRSRVELRDPIKNYNKLTIDELIANSPMIPWKLYFSDRGLANLSYVIVGQPEVLATISKMLKERPLSDWKIYLRWNVLNKSASYLHRAVEEEHFNFFNKILQGQQAQEPRWKRAEQVIDGTIGEALGQLHVEKYFPAESRTRMAELVANLRDVFRDHLQKIDWMEEATRAKALAKFDRFTQKIGHPDQFRDYSAVIIRPNDYFGNVVRASAFEVQRKLVRVGEKVDRSEWDMTPPTVNAYFNPLMNEIVFPAGILQPPFFDAAQDDAVNYGAIAVVIGHEITHGYDDQGRHYDANGVLNEWWTDKDAKEFNTRAQKIVNEFNAFEVLPGVHVNGELTLGENIADLGGVSLAYDALQRALEKDPSKRKLIDGLTPEQRFFISYAQVWRTNARDEELRRRVTIDPHAPGRFRAIGPLMNYQTFYDAFGIKEGSPMWLAPALRAKIW